MATVEEIFAAMPERMDAGAADGVEVIIGWDLSGDESTSKTISISGGGLEVAEGIADDANATISMDSDDFKDLVNGDVNPMMAFMGGKIKIDGDMSAVMKIQNLFGM
ncbi:MAG: SCP2 sterol-binding domain-containing protein [Chloroflexota bacterium]